MAGSLDRLGTLSRFDRLTAIVSFERKASSRFDELTAIGWFD
ncbi:MAG: hypothetical protein Q7S40_01175 [Opitutaceae bacterium]|nr:hypothetical protein [Opitutaceae bacterium]